MYVCMYVPNGTGTVLSVCTSACMHTCIYTIYLLMTEKNIKNVEKKKTDRKKEQWKTNPKTYRVSHCNGPE